MGGGSFPDRYPFADFSSNQTRYASRNPNPRSSWAPHVGTHPFDPFSQPVSGYDPAGSNWRGPCAADGRGGAQKGRVIRIPVQDGKQQHGDASAEVSSRSTAGERAGAAAAGPAPASGQVSQGADVSHQVPKRPKQGVEPVRMESFTAAVKIQTHFRGYRVRRCKPSLRVIARVKERVREFQSEIEKPDVKGRIRESDKERLKYTEGMMVLLLELDSIQGVHPDIRDLRKAMARQVIQLQEGIDCITAGGSLPRVEANADEAMGQQATGIPERTSTSVEAVVDVDSENQNASASSESLQERIPSLEGSTISPSGIPIEAHGQELHKSIESGQNSSEGGNCMHSCEACRSDSHHENCNTTSVVSSCRL